MAVATPTYPTRPQATMELDQEVSSRLLRLCMTGPRRPIDDLIARLDAPDAQAWLAEAFRSRPFDELGIGRAVLEAGAVPLARLVQLKENSKKLVAPGNDGQTKLRGVLGYFTSIAAALVGHGAHISTKDPADVRAALAELAGVAGGGLADLFGRASLPER